MKHCINFEPIDTLFLKDTEKFSERKLSFGICPMCNKPVAILVQLNNEKCKYEIIRKIGISSQRFVESYKKQVENSVSKINRQMFKPSVYGWVYGVNIQYKNKIYQYAKDFSGNRKIIKQIDLKNS